MNVYQVFLTLTLALGASWCAGINLYATVFVLGALHRWIDGFALPGDLAALASDWVLWPALALYCIEFLADKFPAVDSAWDTVHTFIRPPAGAILAAMALGDVPLELQICAALVGGFAAFGSHAVKATVRLAAHATGTSPVVSPAASVAEDALVITAMGLVAAHPLISFFLVLCMIVSAFFILRACWRLARLVVKSLLRGRAPRPGPPAAPAGPCAA